MPSLGYKIYFFLPNPLFFCLVKGTKKFLPRSIAVFNSLRQIIACRSSSSKANSLENRRNTGMQFRKWDNSFSYQPCRNCTNPNYTNYTFSTINLINPGHIRIDSISIFRTINWVLINTSFFRICLWMSQKPKCIAGIIVIQPFIVFIIENGILIINTIPILFLMSIRTTICGHWFICYFI